MAKSKTILPKYGTGADGSPGSDIDRLRCYRPSPKKASRVCCWVTRSNALTDRKVSAGPTEANIAFLSTRLVVEGFGELPKPGRLDTKGAGPLSPDSLASG